MFSRVKPRLPEVTIKTHLSAPANVFIPNFARFRLLICGFAGIVKRKKTEKRVPGKTSPAAESHLK